ncbi:MAG: hypothetical protein M3T56_19925, partial [Chloroflexota bacterium]|nr:hypothetical protein [Chloroflexota bacterium]
ATLLALRPRTGGSNDPARLLSRWPDIKIGVTLGAGHLHQLDVPEPATPIIEWVHTHRDLAAILAAPGGLAARLFAPQPEPSVLVLNESACFNITGVESRLSLRS